MWGDALAAAGVAGAAGGAAAGDSVLWLPAAPDDPDVSVTGV